MTWSRFHFLCREMNEHLQTSESPSVAFEHASQCEAIHWYGPAPKKRSLQFKLEDRLKNTASREKALIATSTYGALDFSEPIKALDKTKRAHIYLSYVTGIYLLASTVYMTKVIPAFMAMYENLDFPVSDDMAWYVDHWNVITATIALVLCLSILSSHTMKRISCLTIEPARSLLFRLLMPSKIKASYQQLLSLMNYPIDYDEDDNELYRHLNQFIHNPGRRHQEITAILNHEKQVLQRRLEAYTTLLLTISGVVIIYSIYFFISSAYQPLFTLSSVS